VGTTVGLDAVDRRRNFVALVGIRSAIPLTPGLSLVTIPVTLPCLVTVPVTLPCLVTIPVTLPCLVTMPVTLPCLVTMPVTLPCLVTIPVTLPCLVTIPVTLPWPTARNLFTDKCCSSYTLRDIYLQVIKLVLCVWVVTWRTLWPCLEYKVQRNTELSHLEINVQVSWDATAQWLVNSYRRIRGPSYELILGLNRSRMICNVCTVLHSNKVWSRWMQRSKRALVLRRYTYYVFSLFTFYRRMNSSCCK